MDFADLKVRLSISDRNYLIVDQLEKCSLVCNQQSTFDPIKEVIEKGQLKLHNVHQLI